MLHIAFYGFPKLFGNRRSRPFLTLSNRRIMLLKVIIKDVAARPLESKARARTFSRSSSLCTHRRGGGTLLEKSIRGAPNGLCCVSSFLLYTRAGGVLTRDEKLPHPV